jgi:hypothetical protein
MNVAESFDDIYAGPYVPIVTISWRARTNVAESYYDFYAGPPVCCSPFQ